MLLLALDTATPSVSAALHDGMTVVAESTLVQSNGHGELLAAAVAEILVDAGANSADLTAVLVGVGPGPFTGLRVGVVTGAALALAWAVPLTGACSLDAVGYAVGSARPATSARGSWTGGFAVLTDARRGELYWAPYDRSGRRVGPARVDRPEMVAAAVGAAALAVTGPAADRYPMPAQCPVLASGPLSAGALASGLLAGSVEPLTARPLYLRRPDATPPGPRKKVLG